MGSMTKISKFHRVLACMLAGVCFLATLYSGTTSTLAATKNKTLTLSTAKILAVAHSEKIEAIELSIEAKEAARMSALKSLTEKQRNMSSFRWSPLLNFKLPTKPNEQEAFEFQYKPIQLQNEIDVLKHKLNDQKLVEYENVSSLFVDICENENKIAFYTERRDALKKSIGKLEVRVIIGSAKKEDVDKSKSELKDVETKLAAATVKYESSKKKLGSAIGLDVTSGYKFENPFVTAELGRNALPYLEAYAKKNDQTLYEASCNEKLELLSLRTNYSLMSNFYGSKINMIKSYVTNAINGVDLSKRAFKKDYDAFLKKIDEPWQGNYRIWFVKFPKEWLKGSLDGIRYIEDDPYVLYQNCIDYQSARKERNNTELDLVANVDDTFENCMACRTAYLSEVSNLKKAQNDLMVGDVQYALGQLSDDEYRDLVAAVNTAVTAEADALAAYSTAVYEFDRLTCGGVSAFFESQNIDMTGETRVIGSPEDEEPENAEEMLNAMVPVYEEGITYSIEYLAEEQMFDFRIDVPEGFSVDHINYFELWCDNQLIGQRTPIDQSLRSMLLSTSEITKSEIRFYTSSSGGYLTTCEFDATVSKGTLAYIKSYNTFTSEGMVIGDFTVKNDTDSGKIQLTLKLNNSYGVGKFAVRSGNSYKETSGSITSATGGKLYLKSDTAGQYADIDESYSYLEAISDDLEDLTIEFTDKEGNPLFEAIFSPEDQSIVVPKSQLEYINQYQAGE